METVGIQNATSEILGDCVNNTTCLWRFTQKVRILFSQYLRNVNCTKELFWDAWQYEKPISLLSRDPIHLPH